MHSKQLSRAGAVYSLVIAAVAILATGCASKYPPAPSSIVTEDYRYVIGPLDNVNIIVWRNPELSMSVPVRPDGRITTPLVEDLFAYGKDPSALAREIEKALAKYIREPIVTVIVTGFVGPTSEQVRVIGEAQRPQAIPYRLNMTVLDVMIAVGGLTDFADGNSAVLLRAADSNKQQYNVRLRDLVKRGDVSANIDMKPGDVLVIPQSWF